MDRNSGLDAFLAESEPTEVLRRDRERQHEAEWIARECERFENWMEDLEAARALFDGHEVELSERFEQRLAKDGRCTFGIQPEYILERRQAAYYRTLSVEEKRQVRALVEDVVDRKVDAIVAAQRKVGRPNADPNRPIEVREAVSVFLRERGEKVKRGDVETALSYPPKVVRVALNQLVADGLVEESKVVTAKFVQWIGGE